MLSAEEGLPTTCSTICTVGTRVESARKNKKVAEAVQLIGINVHVSDSVHVWHLTK